MMRTTFGQHKFSRNDFMHESINFSNNCTSQKQFLNYRSDNDTFSFKLNPLVFQFGMIVHKKTETTSGTMSGATNDE